MFKRQFYGIWLFISFIFLSGTCFGGKIIHDERVLLEAISDIGEKKWLSCSGVERPDFEIIFTKSCLQKVSDAINSGFKVHATRSDDSSVIWRFPNDYEFSTDDNINTELISLIYPSNSNRVNSHSDIHRTIPEVGSKGEYFNRWHKSSYKATRFSGCYELNCYIDEQRLKDGDAIYSDGKLSCISGNIPGQCTAVHTMYKRQINETSQTDATTPTTESLPVYASEPVFVGILAGSFFLGFLSGAIIIAIGCYAINR